MFAAIYAIELICGKGVAGLQAPFDVAAMRPYLERCFEEQVMNPFPLDAASVHEQRKAVGYASSSTCKEWPGIVVCLDIELERLHSLVHLYTKNLRR